MLGEFLSANVSTPFLLFMVKGMFIPAGSPGKTLNVPPGFGQYSDEAEIAFWTGILGAPYEMSSMTPTLTRFDQCLPSL
jgi:hypothetical protein